MTALAAPSAPVLAVEDVRVHAGATPIVNGVSFALAPGERVGLIGESGSGKSLTALAVMGLLPEELTATGAVLFGGRDLMGLSDRELGRLRGDRLAMVFQEPMTALNPLMRVGRSNRLSTRAISTISPAYMTATRSAMEATTPRLWVMKIIAMPVSSRSWRSSTRICAWMVTSSAVVGSSAISRRGLQASAIAIKARWRMPPES